jgi:FkbM family methyltransferase
MICFEPHPETFKKLVNNVSHLEVEIVNMGIGDSNQPMTLFDYADKDGSAHASLYKAVIETIHGGASISHKVEMTTLDSFAHDNGISQIDFVKIDVEGYELSVLKGMKELISSRKVGYVQVEFNEMNAVSKTFFEDICSHLPFHNPHRLLPHGMIDLSSKSIVERNLFAFQNIIFIPVDYKTSLYGNAAYADERNREN